MQQQQLQLILANSIPPIVRSNDLRMIVQGFMRSSQNLLNNPTASMLDKRYLEGRLDMATTLLGFVLRLDKTEIQGELDMQLTTFDKPTTIEEVGLGAGNGEIARELLALAAKLKKPGDCIPLNGKGMPKVQNISSALHHLRKAQKLSKAYGIRKIRTGKSKGAAYLVLSDAPSSTNGVEKD